MKRFLISLIVLFSFCFCKGQGREAFIQYTIDSLNQIHAVSYRKVKTKEKAFFIKVRSQQEFDELNETIEHAIDAGRTNIHVKIAKGIYRFRENHISLKGLQKNVLITITGKRSVLTSCSDIKDAYNDPWMEMTQMDDIIEVIDKDNKICKIPLPNQWDKEMRRSMSRVQVTQWFRAPIYDVEYIDSNGIFFIAKELKWDNSYKYKGYNVNLDYLYSGKKPRYRLYDSRVESTAKASCFIKIENTDGISLDISGIKFIGNKSGAPLLSMNNVQSGQVYVHNCIFNHIHTNIGNFSNVSHVIFDRNTIINTDGHEVRFVNNCEKVQVTNNKFKHCGKAIGQTFCVTCWECNYHISNNSFQDFGYAAIGVGVWHGYTKLYPSRGIIEHNELSFTLAYLAETMRHSLMDSGAIYVWTQNDDVIIRYNYIHDYAGAGDNRGIFCDDGACNLKIYRNVVLNTPNCYSIDSRKSKDQHEGFFNNSNNFIACNIVDNGIRFQGYDEEERHCYKGTNYVFHKEGRALNLDMKYDNLEVSVDDVVVSEKWVKAQIKALND